MSKTIEKVRVILNLPEELVEQLTVEYIRLGLPSRNAYIIQCIRSQLKLPNIVSETE